MKRLKAVYTAAIAAAGIGFLLLILDVILLTGPTPGLVVEFGTALGWLVCGLVVAGIARYLMWWRG